MEKIFTPNRWFVAFCALLILVVGALKIVGDMHLAEEAKQVALNIFTFDWAELGVASRVQAINAHVINRNDHDALVEVSGRQMIAKLAAPAEPVANSQPENAEFKANLTFYRANNGWELGKVEQLN
jgi:hypothetical protein